MLFRNLLLVVVTAMTISVITGDCKFQVWANGYWREVSYMCKKESFFGKLIPFHNPYMKPEDE